MTTIDILIFILAAIICFGFIFISVLEEFLLVRRKLVKLVDYKVRLSKYEVGSKKYIKIQSKISDLEYILELYNLYEVK